MSNENGETYIGKLYCTQLCHKNGVVLGGVTFVTAKYHLRVDIPIEDLLTYGAREAVIRILSQGVLEGV